MKAIVFISTVYNPEENLSISDKSFNPVQEFLIANDFDLIAVEAAVQLKERGNLDEVIVFGISPTKDHLLKALAMGADRAVYAEADNAEITPEIVVETALSVFPDTDDTIWMLGKIGVNFESHQTAQILASRLVNAACIDAAFEIQRKEKVWFIRSEADGVIPTWKVDPPFVVTSDLRLATPRFPSLPNIIKARKKPFQTIPVVRPDKSVHLETISLSLTQDNQRTCCFLNNAQVVAKIREEIVTILPLS